MVLFRDHSVRFTLRPNILAPLVAYLLCVRTYPGLFHNLWLLLSPPTPVAPLLACVQHLLSSQIPPPPGADTPSDQACPIINRFPWTIKIHGVDCRPTLTLLPSGFTPTPERALLPPSSKKKKIIIKIAIKEERGHLKMRRVLEKELSTSAQTQNSH